MIPLRLTMRNFMCHADSCLNFTAFHLACLTGENGHGKSAILDALTWALWGKSRSQRDDDLVRLGETDMMVELDFTLGAHEYRVLRKRHRNGSRGSSVLELQIRDGEVYRALTGDTIRDTQQLISQTLRMEYETFINSAFLMQGRADEFTMKRPAERKRVLGEILDLSFYDRCEERAKARAKEIRTALVQVQAALVQIGEELGHRAEHEEELAQMSVEAERLAAELEEVQATLNAAKEKAAGFAAKQQMLDEAMLQWELAAGELSKLVKRLENLREFGLDSAQRDEEIEGFQHELETLHQRIEQAESGALEKTQEQLREVRDELALLEDAEDRREQVEAAIAGYEQEKASLTATNASLREAMNKLKEGLDKLQEADAACPLCGSELSEEHREEILAQKQADGEAKAQAFRENNETIKRGAEQVDGLRNDLAKIKRQIAQVKALRATEADLLARIARLESEGERVEEWKAQTGKITQAIAEVKQRYQERTDQAIAEAEAEEEKQRGRVDELAEKREALEGELAGVEELKREVQELSAQVTQAELDLSRARLSMGAARQKVDHCDYLERQKTEKEAEEREAQERLSVYDELRVAFGKKGIQAIIIEGVIPEIEDEANRLLGKMTDGRMHVRLLSQRETLKGDAVETLEIEVADEMGPRNYSLFSGGEAFRINFAIRIAISKLLARRAGARVQTLIVDEGFGTQDAGGRERLVEAISSVAEDFERILVITHIEELRDAFPARVEVVKGAEGSVVRVS